jgi:hypothetical protein
MVLAGGLTIHAWTSASTGPGAFIAWGAAAVLRARGAAARGSDRTASPPGVHGKLRRGGRRGPTERSGDGCRPRVTVRALLRGRGWGRTFWPFGDPEADAHGWCEADAERRSITRRGGRSEPAGPEDHRVPRTRKPRRSAMRPGQLSRSPAGPSLAPPGRRLSRDWPHRSTGRRAQTRSVRAARPEPRINRPREAHGLSWRAAGAVVIGRSLHRRHRRTGALDRLRSHGSADATPAPVGDGRRALGAVTRRWFRAPAPDPGPCRGSKRLRPPLCTETASP